jgi:hypothetical protein
VERKRWLAGTRGSVSPPVRKALENWYGAERAARVKHAEAFELCEYGYQPDEQGLRRLFPMMK